MKHDRRSIVLFAIILLLTLSACERTAARPSVTTPTTGGGGELPFPVSTMDLAAIGTATALASNPLPVLPTNPPQVVVSTETAPVTQPEQPQPAQPTNTEQQPAQPQAPAPTADPNIGGGVVTQPQPEQPAQPAAPTPEVVRPATYTLMSGEFAYCIARRFNVDPGSMLAANGLGPTTPLSAGATLTIPATGTWNEAAFGPRSLRAHPVDYTVGAGESVYSIACKFGDVTPEAILAVNGIGVGDVTAGRTIRIP